MPNFTTTWLDNVRTPIADKTDYYDTAKGSPAGFGVRVSSTGRKTFFVKYLLHGKQKRTSIPTKDGGTATFPAIKLSGAREMARKLVSDVMGDRPHRHHGDRGHDGDDAHRHQQLYQREARPRAAVGMSPFNPHS